MKLHWHLLHGSDKVHAVLQVTTAAGLASARAWSLNRCMLEAGAAMADQQTHRVLERLYAAELPGVPVQWPIHSVLHPVTSHPRYSALRHGRARYDRAARGGDTGTHLKNTPQLAMQEAEPQFSQAAGC